MKLLTILFAFALLCFYPVQASAMRSMDNSSYSCLSGSRDVKVLAAKALNCKRITFKNGARKHFISTMNTGQQLNRGGGYGYCGKPVAIDPNLIQAMLSMTPKYTIVLGATVTDHRCNGGFHPRGKAIDINGVGGYVSGKWVTTGKHITASDLGTKSAKNTLLRNFYLDLGKQIAALNNKKPKGSPVINGGLGQSQCFTGGAPKVKGNISYFTGDSCDHIHFDIR